MNQLNEYGIPLHACNGYRHDEHYWAWAQWVIGNCKKVGYDGLKVYYEKPVH